MCETHKMKKEKELQKNEDWSSNREYKLSTFLFFSFAIHTHFRIGLPVSLPLSPSLFLFLSLSHKYTTAEQT